MELAELRKVSVDETASRLGQPFLMVGLADVGHHHLSVYYCLGAVGWHRHLDEDELFLGYTGATTIETGWGEAVLPAGYLVQVPKGLPHRSYAATPSVVLLVQTGGMPARRNGHLPSSNSEDRQIKPVSISRQVAPPLAAYVPRRLAITDGLAVSAQVCNGAQDWHRHDGEQLVLCHHGRIIVQVETGGMPLAPGELLVVPSGDLHRVLAVESAIAVTMAEIE